MTSSSAAHGIPCILRQGVLTGKGMVVCGAAQPPANVCLATYSNLACKQHKVLGNSILPSKSLGPSSHARSHPQLSRRSHGKTDFTVVILSSSVCPNPCLFHFRSVSGVSGLTQPFPFLRKKSVMIARCGGARLGLSSSPPRS